MNRTVELTEEEWKSVLGHLANGRYIEVAQLIEKIALQLKPAPATPAPSTPST